ncbi:MAG: ATP-dependent DNA helicase [Ornithinimicrobium sp.]|uniref:ATP-dependent helicase n=1 Tax=Ornithinimicrobium sp. TaxID=1977084 RepID=UPI0026E0D523|nr:ATP-dependent DNA helicase [Ornithinimicrobium sp.]MDO5739117.1 ATP-dependent DNA helicase [Ornithinimicrobium sp.]
MIDLSEGQVLPVVDARYSPAQLAGLLGTHLPTPEQTAIIGAPLLPTVVVAGAGSGKTETMAARVVWLIANGFVLPQDVLGLTFTRKAALELSARLADKLGLLRAAGIWTAPSEVDGAGTEHTGRLSAAQMGQVDAFDLPTVSTYHAYAGRLVAEHGLRLGIEPDARLLSEAACWQLAHEVVISYGGDMEAMDRAESTVVRAVLGLAGELGEHLVEPDEAARWIREIADRLRFLPGAAGKKPKVIARDLANTLDMQALVYPIVEAYRRAKTAQGALDFGDQMALAARLARDVPEVAKAERIRYRAVLLDEFQDTSEAQMVLMTSLFAGADLPVTAVGDPHQSIYGWRGASATTLTRFPMEFAVGGQAAKVLHLSTSWRNDEAVLAAANAVAAPLRETTRIPVRTLHARPGAGDGVVEVARLCDHVTEAEHVAAWVKEHWGRAGGRTAAVLCRARAQFPTVVDALRRQGLPVEVVGLGGLLDTPEVLDLVALLWVVQEPTRGDQVMRLLTGPVCRLGAADVDVLWSWARQQGRWPQDQRLPQGTDQNEPGREHAPVLAEAVDSPPPPGWVDAHAGHLSPEATARVAWLSGVLHRVRALARLPLPDLVLEAERLLELDLEVAADPDLHPTWGRAQLDALTDVAAGFAAGADRASLGGFLDWLDAAREHERGLEGAEIPELAEISVDASAVQVLTVHAAKGLEWDVVAVPGLVEGTFPSGTVRATHDGTAWRVGDRKDKAWLAGIGNLPTPLRGDREGRPTLPWSSVPDTGVLDAEFARLVLDGGTYAVQEERRLAYVAFTRARHRMLLTAPVWSTGKTPRVTSRFLLDVRSDAQAGEGTVVREWAPMPDPDDPSDNVNPRAAQEASAPWPVDPQARRRVVRDVATALMSSGSVARIGPPEAAGPSGELAALLLAERAEQRLRSPQPDLPEHLSTSAVVALAQDPRAFRARLRRPLPTAPAPHARLGTAFHAWVEQHFAQAALVDVHEILDPDTESDPGEQLELLQQHFLASEWADRRPVAVEVGVETAVGKRSIRGRLDAVFTDPDGGVTILDWKTGRPGTLEQQRLRALQLAVYRIAYARLTGRDPEQVRAAFFFAATGETVRPQLPNEAELEDLLDELSATS